MANYKSKYQGETGIFKASEKTSGQTYKGKKKKDAPFFDPHRIINFLFGKKKT
jgi:hypothetical protein